MKYFYCSWNVLVCFIKNAQFELDFGGDFFFSDKYLLIRAWRHTRHSEVGIAVWILLGGHHWMGMAGWAPLGRHLWVAHSTLWGVEGMCLVEGVQAAVAGPLPITLPV